MIRELGQSEFHKCEKLVNDEGHLEVKAVIQGNNPGRIFVDNQESPKTGMIWLGNHDGFFFIGDEENGAFNDHINDFLAQVIFPEAKKMKVHNFIAIGHHSRWEETLERVFKYERMQKSNQNVYKMAEIDDINQNEPLIYQDYKVVKINKELLDNTDNKIENVGFLRSKIKEFWSSPLEFFQKGEGYGIIYHNKVVSLCFSGFVAGKVHSIDVETLEEHQENKLGQKAAHNMVKECLRKGLIPYWDCEVKNAPSNTIAKKLGLDMYLNYNVYIFPIED
ncbi:GNAT family N-acetyltransferase [Halobacillus sp. GSS1]|uniref:GNAT family N-acetyltransferase n=1 Tax=Halobacillus sp. GSS1 TaxID=2815919 RepID=UPI001A8E67BE|nr:GNAT family N-acetyltransferase [Halobacillus sp. GSS1]MBN9653186.1 GNAT family N-acetyltransferase [Halobacillus sp. GSS1]